MSFVNQPSPALRELLERQDAVVGTSQLAEHDFDRHTLHRRIRTGQWQRLLPTVILTISGSPTRRQLLVAAHLWGGPGSSVDGADACRWHGLEVERPDDRVHVVVPRESPARSRDFVVVRRSIAAIPVHDRAAVPYVDPATAVIVAARNAGNERAALAILSRALQQNITSQQELATARDMIGDKWCRQVDSALIAVGIGLRSPAERDQRDLILQSRRLPEPLWNQWVDLGDGGPSLCLDALFPEAALVSEVEGRRYHAWAEQFERMHARHERLSAVGFVVVHPTPTRLRTDGESFLRALEQTYARYRGRGIPPGVRLLDGPRMAA